MKILNEWMLDEYIFKELIDFYFFLFLFPIFITTMFITKIIFIATIKKYLFYFCNKIFSLLFSRTHPYRRNTQFKKKNGESTQTRISIKITFDVIKNVGLKMRIH